MKKQTYREYFNSKPSAALRAMVTGLEMTDEERGFHINMRTYGDRNRDGTCFGCAATSTVRACLKEKIPAENIASHYERADFAEADAEDEGRFEYVMNQARTGEMFYLFKYMGKDCRDYHFLHPNFYLANFNYKAEIPKVKLFIEELEVAGY
jgi:hypothetical protein